MEKIKNTLHTYLISFLLSCVILYYSSSSLRLAGRMFFIYFYVCTLTETPTKQLNADVLVMLFRQSFRIVLNLIDLYRKLATRYSAALTTALVIDNPLHPD